MLENHGGFRRVSYFIMKKLTTEEFVKKAEKIHQGKYDYSKVNYVNSKTKVDIICPIHGKFQQQHNNHLYGQGCSKCAKNNITMKNKEFIKKAQQIHGQKYDYQSVNYYNNRTKVKIICPKHGVFQQIPHSHLQGNGCPKCSNNVKLTNEEFIKKAQQIHGQKYDYQLIDYKNAHTKVKIICTEHGIFEQLPYQHLQKSGCKKCGEISSIKKRHKNQEDIIFNFIKIHGDKYDYSKADYVKLINKIEIVCRNHGSFWQSSHSHLKGIGCPKCKSIISKPEIEVQDFIKSLGFKIITNSRKILNGKELDIYIPELNKAIEFNGTYWHYSKKHFVQGKHANKSKLCKSKNINLLHLREDLWKKDKEKMKKVINKFLDFKN